MARATDKAYTKGESMKKKIRRLIIVDLIILVAVAVAIGISMPWSQDIELELGLLYYTDEPVPEEDIVVLDRRNAGLAARVSDGELNVHFVDVGQGDCAIIEFPDGKTAVIDGGERFNAQKTAIQAFIDTTFDESFKYFDYAILTHPDSDHCGNFDYILNNYPARVSYRPNVEAVGSKDSLYTDPGKADLKPNAVPKTTAQYIEAIESMYNPTAEHDFTPTVYVTDPSDETQTIKGGEGDGAYSLTFFSPLSYNYGTTEKNAEWNNYSPIMILSYRGFNFAMSGDAEKDNLNEFVEKVASAKTDGVTDKYDIFDDNFCVNVVKAGHHGSENATTIDYLEAITSPQAVSGVYCVISCGEGNTYKHPHQAALDRYATVGVTDENVLRTDKLGDINFTVRVGENGEYSLFYGETASAPTTPENPDKPNKPDDNNDETGETCIYPEVLVYLEVGGIKMKWPLVAWTAYAVLVVAAAAHIVIVSIRDSSR